MVFMKTVLITGANRGIGLGFCRYYLNQGWQVIAATRAGLNQSFLAEFNAETLQHLHQVNIELEDEYSIKAAAQSIMKLCQNIDLFISNAGVSLDQSLGYWTQAAFVKSYQVNAVGPALLIQALEYHFNEGSKIVQLTSGLSSLTNNVNPLGPFDAYAMSKVAVNMLMRRLAHQFASQKIVVCTLSPGWVQTDMGGADAPMTVAQTIPQLINTIDNIKLNQSGGFFDENGAEIAW